MRRLGRIDSVALHRLWHIANGGKVHRIERIVVVHILLVDFFVIGGKRVELLERIKGIVHGEARHRTSFVGSCSFALRV